MRSCRDPWLHTSDLMARELLVGVFATLAKYESQRRSERIRAGFARRKAEGLPVGASPGPGIRARGAAAGSRPHGRPTGPGTRSSVGVLTAAPPPRLDAPATSGLLVVRGSGSCRRRNG